MLSISGAPPSAVTYQFHNTVNTSTITVYYRTYPHVQTYFQCYGVHEVAVNNVPLVDMIYLPDGSHYQFTYELTPNGSGNVTGRVASVQTPQGGMISYSYGAMNCVDGSPLSMTRVISGNVSPAGTWTYTRSVFPPYQNSGTTVTTAAGDTIGLQFQGNYETLRQYTGSAGFIGQTNHAYSDNFPNSATNEIDVTAWVVDHPGAAISLGKEVDTIFAGMMPTSVKERDWSPYGSGQGNVLRETDTQYTVFNLPSSVTVKDGNGSPVAQTLYTYDEGTLSPTSAPQHTAVACPCGNLTTVSRMVSAGNYVNSHFTYDDTGNVLTAQDPGLHTTTYVYDPNLAYGFATQTHYPQTGSVQHNVGATYDINTGLLTSSTDQNNQVTSYHYDNMLRLTETDFPDGGQTTSSYTSNSATSTQKISATTNLATTSLFDGFGRLTQTQLTSDPEGAVYVDTGYDSVGKVHSVSNPHRAAASPTDGATYTQYDALGRVTQVTEQDGNTIQTQYTGNCATVTDETNRKRKSCSDALGRLTQVWEDPSGLNYETDYAYDLLDNLTSVNQKGDGSAPRTRSFVYDSLSRLTDATNPESGHVHYGYDNDGNLISKTDARAVTTYGYDALNRLTSKSYSDGTPAVNLYYDESSVWGVSPSNQIGRLTHYVAAGGFASTIFSYDAMGRLNHEWPCTPSICGQGSYPVSATYDLAGNMTSLTYPSGRKINQTFSAANRLTTVSFDSFNGISVNYPYFFVNQNAANWQSWTYWPSGATHYDNFGNGTAELFQLNSRQQLQDIVLGAPTGWNVNSPNYWSARTNNFYDSANHNNGNVWSLADWFQGGRNQSFSYDSLNRISSASQTDGSWAQTYNIDPWGNLNQSGTYSFVQAFDRNNRISTGGYAYDAAGDLVNDTFHTYAYDAEGRVSSVDGGGAAQYTYDADGQRVRKDANGGATEYIYFGGQVIAEKNVSTGDWSDYIYANGKRIAKADTFANRVHVFGNRCSSCGTQWDYFQIPASFNTGYVLQSGDRLYLRQWESSGASGGILVWFTDGSNAGPAMDQDGQPSYADSTSETWHARRIDLSQWVGKTLYYIEFVSSGNTSPGTWDQYYQDVAIVSADGTVRPFFNNQPSVALYAGGQTGSTQGYAIDKCAPCGQWPWDSTEYYHEDHLGTSRLIISAMGWPVWQGTFLPFGQELNPQPTVNHYKFTGMEQDAETQLNHTWFRQQSPAMGRWMTPDPAGLAAADLSNPQSLNRYAYVLNNPMNFRDPLGLECVWDDGSFDAEDDSDTGSVGGCQGAGGTWIELGQGGGWSPDPASFNNGMSLASVAGQIQAGNVSSISILGSDGMVYQTGYNGAGQATYTNTPDGGLTIYGSATAVATSDGAAGWVEYGGCCLAAPAPGGLTPVAAGLFTTTPKPGLWFGTNYCGPGGSGAVIQGTMDPGCSRHDTCYTDNGFTPGSNFNYFMSSGREHTLQQCNQALCDYASAHPDTSGSTLINDYFKSVPVGACHSLAHGVRH